MPKAIAVQAVFLIGVIAISLFFISAIFFGWIDTTKFGTSQASCTAKKTSYCSGLINSDKEPFAWDEKEPTDCGREGIEISQPTKAECCSTYGKGLKCE